MDQTLMIVFGCIVLLAMLSYGVWFLIWPRKRGIVTIHRSTATWNVRTNRLEPGEKVLPPDVNVR